MAAININSENTALVKQLDKSVIHRICTGQVISGLAGACKELIENALDAGSTAVDIRLVDHGSIALEVCDNGNGIHQNAFGSIGQAHFTSKLQQFSELAFLTTYGFRGEALSALAAIAKLTISTRHASSDTASKLDFNHDGSLKLKTTCARTVGTSVLVENFLEPLPVRRREFERNVRKQFQQLIAVVQSFALITEKVRFQLTNTVKGQKQIIVSTYANQSMKENICNVFNAKILENLMRFVHATPTAEQLEEYGLNESDLPGNFMIEGYVSLITKGVGRSSGDRQFVYVNNRPCEYGKVLKLINEVYHQYNKTQYPVVILNIQVAPDQIDVNVSPDKRQIFLANEKLLFCVIKSSLMNMYEQFSRVCLSNEASTSRPNIISAFNKSASKHAVVNALSKFKRSKKNSEDGDLEDEELEEDFVMEPRSKQKKLTEGFVVKKKTEKPALHDSSMETSAAENTSSSFRGFVCQNVEDFELFDLPVSNAENSHVEQNNGVQNDVVIDLPANAAENLPVETAAPIHRKSGDIYFSFDVLQRFYEAIEDDFSCIFTDSDGAEAFKAKIVPEDNANAELELRRSLNKEDFLEMTILGQFNLGFIITQFKNDLFIVDQHASDEKYNYETLQKMEVVQNQKLINALPLELTPPQEDIVIQRMDVFKKNGFEFLVDETHIDEIVAMLDDDPHMRMYRPVKVRQVLASRACRKSVMIGKSLCRAEMEKILQHLAEIDQPWNCPHGRPTVRHLLNLCHFTSIFK